MLFLILKGILESPSQISLIVLNDYKFVLLESKSLSLRIRYFKLSQLINGPLNCISIISDSSNKSLVKEVLPTPALPKIQIQLGFF